MVGVTTITTEACVLLHSQLTLGTHTAFGTRTAFSGVQAQESLQRASFYWHAATAGVGTWAAATAVCGCGVGG